MISHETDGASVLLALVRYQHATSPLRESKSRRRHPSGDARTSKSPAGPAHARQRSSFAQDEWRRIAEIARHAGQDDQSSTDVDSHLSGDELEQYRKTKAEQKRERQKYAKMMGLDYFLEMVDSKHRYGSHLRAYHGVWMRSDTNENFFHWLDHGEGKTSAMELFWPRHR